MARLLVRAISNTHPDPAKDLRGCYKRGHVVAVFNDPHTFGLGEGLPDFYVIDIPKVKPVRVLKYLDGGHAGDDPASGEHTRRRKWRIRIQNLPPAIRNRLRNTGRIVLKGTALYTGAFDMTWANFKSRMRDDVNARDETGDLE